MEIGYACLIFILFMATSGTSATDVDDFMDKPEDLQPYYAEINAALHEKLPHDEDVHSNLEKAGELEEDSRTIKSWMRSSGQKLKLAYKRFNLIPYALNSCDSKSYHILAGNFLANDGEKLDLKLYDRTRKVIQFYRLLHAKMCLPGYKEDFKKKIAHTREINSVCLERVEPIFVDISLEDFQIEPKVGADSLITVPSIDFTLITSSEAVKKILRKLEVQIKARHDYWDLMKPELDSESGLMKYPQKAPRGVFDLHLFRPCASYRLNLSETLDAARFDLMALDDTERKTHIRDEDDNFRRALINNRLCARLIEQKEDMYPVLIEAWGKLSVE